jgi:hypothetical protein
MGTSTSFRAPPVPRWQAFTTALREGLPLERVHSELFNAGAEWEDTLATPAVAAFAVALAQAGEVLPDRLATVDRPEHVLRAYVAEARAASLREGGTPALALAERAFAALLTREAAAQSPLSTQSSEAAAAHLGSALAQPGAAVVAYLGELLGQYARHVVSRETGGLTESPAGVGVAETRRTARSLAARAEELGHGIPAPRGDPDAVREGWAGLVHEAFHRGRQLPREEE